ncbi:unnamed protein product [Gongylonema pulchrum]|uniref:Uncharacterized protein n=1 Tax=Gongylonema pulchrum TaxID=637853 RepID=A0A183EQC0_9BILA|nr:unnamed protein product [Gongylonema pulchrum]
MLTSAEGTSAASNQIVQQPSHLLSTATNEFPATCNASNDSSSNTSNSRNSNNGGSPTSATIRLLDRSAPVVSSYPCGYHLLKDTVNQQNHVESFLERIVASSDVTFL